MNLICSDCNCYIVSKRAHKKYCSAHVNDPHCEKCGEILDPLKAVSLELNFKTGEYALPGTVPVEESQGVFWFGKQCADKIMRR